jgi:hypothetical protein
VLSKRSGLLIALVYPSPSPPTTAWTYPSGGNGGQRRALFP